MAIIRLLATSDVHGYIYPYSYATGQPENIGLARLKTMIDQLRDENTLVIDNGDQLEGSPLMFYHFHEHPDQPAPVSQAVRAVGYDYVCLGNHDFNYGMDVLQQHLSVMETPCLTSNLTYQGQALGPDYVIRQLAGKTLALFGIVTQYIPHWEKPEHIAGVEFTDAYDKARATVNKIREEHPEVDYVIGIYHGGFERDLTTGELMEDDTGENEGSRMLEIPGLDILISGHQHRSLAGTAHGTAYTQTLDKGKELAVIEIDTVSGQITPKVVEAACAPDPGIMKLVQPSEDACQKWLDTPLGISRVDLSVKDDMQGRIDKAQVITLMNEAAMDATGADLASNALFDGAVGFSHNITMRQIVSTYVFPNTLVVKQMSGKTLKSYLEQCAEFWTIQDGKLAVSPKYSFPKVQNYNYDMTDGVEYTIDVSKPVGQRITSLTRQGKPVQPDDLFTFAFSNYRASGGGNFNMVRDAKTVKEVSDSMIAILAEYILRKKVIDFEPVHNIRVIM